MSLIFCGEHILDDFHALRMRRTLGILETQVYHWILSHVFAALGVFRNGHAVEQCSIGWWIATVAVRWRGLKEVADHAEVQGFAEAPGRVMRCTFAGVIDKMRYETGFIDKVAIIVDEFLEIGDALSQILFHDGF